MPKTFLYEYVKSGDSKIIKKTYKGEHSYYIARVNKKPDSKKYMYVNMPEDKKFPEIPKDIYYLDIDFWDQKIEYPEIPEHIKSLTFYSNKISKFPKNLPKGLLRLSFSGCINITEIPDISYLKKLRSFEFFRSYPMKDINPSHLPHKLERLEISGTGLTKFPCCLPQSLKHIDFSYQEIKTFPDINYLKKLKKFTMLRNPLDKFPKETPRKDIYIELVDLKYPTIKRGMVYPPSGYIPTKLKKPFAKAYSNQMKMVYSR
jgi:Leucine-rich repeat (LRR) protein